MSLHVRVPVAVAAACSGGIGRQMNIGWTVDFLNHCDWNMMLLPCISFSAYPQSLQPAILTGVLGGHLCQAAGI